MGTIREQVHAALWAWQQYKTTSDCVRVLEENAKLFSAAEETAAERDRLAASNAALREVCELSFQYIQSLAGGVQCDETFVSITSKLRSALAASPVEHHSQSKPEVSK